MPSLMTNSPSISSRQAKSSNTKQWLQEDELDILKEFLKDWIAGDTAQRQTIFKNVGDHIQHLAPNRMLKSCQWDMKAKWTQRAVITYQQKDRINRVLKKSGLKLGTKQWIGKYQAAVGKVMKMMSSEEVATAIVTTEKWNKTCPPPEVHSRAAEQKGRKYTQQFAEEVDVLPSFHNYNDEITNGQMFDNWGHMEDRWCQYTNDMFGPSESPQPEDSGQEATPQKKIQKSQKKPEYELNVDGDGNLQLPVILNMAGREKKALMCAFAAFHYKKVCGQQSATVPWGAISDDMEKYISSGYLPTDVRFKEPTKLSVDETTRILGWWQDWQEGSPNDIFRFKMWINSDGSVHPLVSAGHQQLKMARKQKLHVKDKISYIGGMIQPIYSMTDDSDDTEDNDEHRNMKDCGDELHLKRDETSEMENSNADSHEAMPITCSSIKAGHILQDHDPERLELLRRGPRTQSQAFNVDPSTTCLTENIQLPKTRV
ncbi:hypothetical protein J3A83DRAFT_4374571 [Scleroderma citrinum]